MDYNHEDVMRFWQEWWKGLRAHPIKVSIFILLTLVLGSLLVTGIAYFSTIGTRLASAEAKIDDIAAAMETLIIVQRIDHIENDNSIVLDYDPIPQSVRISVGPLVHYPRANYGYKLDGRVLRILHPDPLKQITERLKSGGVIVEYVRKVHASP